MGVVAFTATAVFSAEDYNSSRSNTQTSIAIVNQQVGDILLRYGADGAEINKVTDALARGISKVDLKAMLVFIYNSTRLNVTNRLLNEQNEEGFIKEVFTELDRLGVGINEEGLQAVSTPSTGDATTKEVKKWEPPPSTAKEKEKEPQPSAAKEAKKAEPVEVKKSTPQELQTVRKRPGRVKYGDITLKRAVFHDAAMNIIQNIRSAAPEERKDLIDELRANRETIQTEILSMRLSIRGNAQELRENFRETVILKWSMDNGSVAYRRIVVAHGKGLRMLNRFRSAMARFDHILGRLESRVDKLEARGVDTSAVIPLIEEAKNMSIENEVKMEKLKAKYESLLKGENLQGIAKEARAIAKTLKTEIENLHAKLREIVDEIKQATKDYNSSISNSSSKKITLIQNTIEKIQERLKSCDSTDVCDIVERHAEQRAELTDTTKKAIENRNWEETTRLLREVRGIVAGDIELLEGVENIGSIVGVLELERSLLNYVDSALVSI